MKHTRIVLATGTLLAALALGVGQAAAHGGQHAHSQAAAPGDQHANLRAAAERQDGVRGLGLQAVASYLGVTTDALQAELQTGKSLAQVADATSGKSSAGLVAALMAGVQAKLDAAVAAGKLTAVQEQALSAKLTDEITKLVNRVWSDGSDH